MCLPRWLLLLVPGIVSCAPALVTLRPLNLAEIDAGELHVHLKDEQDPEGLCVPYACNAPQGAEICFGESVSDYFREDLPSTLNGASFGEDPLQRSDAIVALRGFSISLAPAMNNEGCTGTRSPFTAEVVLSVRDREGLPFRGPVVGRAVVEEINQDRENLPGFWYGFSNNSVPQPLAFLAPEAIAQAFEDASHRLKERLEELASAFREVTLHSGFDADLPASFLLDDGVGRRTVEGRTVLTWTEPGDRRVIVSDVSFPPDFSVLVDLRFSRSVQMKVGAVDAKLTRDRITLTNADPTSGSNLADRWVSLELMKRGDVFRLFVDGRSVIFSRKADYSPSNALVISGGDKVEIDAITIR